MAADQTGLKQRGRPFAKGVSGNPRGRPPGARSKTTIAAELLLDGEAEALTRKAVELAKAGDMVAMRLCLDRLIPPRKDRRVAFALPAMVKAEDAATAMASITAAVAKGELTLAEAASLSTLVDNFLRSLEATDLEQRVAALEQRRA